MFGLLALSWSAGAVTPAPTGSASCAQLYCWQPSAGSLVPPHAGSASAASAAVYFAADQASRVKTHVRRMRHFATTAFEQLADTDTRDDDEGGDVESAFPYLWLSLQEAVAVTEKAGSDADAWHAVVQQLMLVFEKRVLNQVKLRTVAEYMRKALSMRRSAARAASYLRWLNRLPELVSKNTDVEFIAELRAFVALLEQEAKTGDAHFDSNLEDAKDLFLPGMPQLLSASDVESSSRDYMTTFSLWPTRISTVPLAKQFVSALVCAAAAAVRLLLFSPASSLACPVSTAAAMRGRIWQPESSIGALPRSICPYAIATFARMLTCSARRGRLHLPSFTQVAEHCGRRSEEQLRS